MQLSEKLTRYWQPDLKSNGFIPIGLARQHCPPLIFLVIGRQLRCCSNEPCDWSKFLIRRQVHNSQSYEIVEMTEDWSGPPGNYFSAGLAGLAAVGDAIQEYSCPDLSASQFCNFIRFHNNTAFYKIYDEKNHIGKIPPFRGLRNFYVDFWILQILTVNLYHNTDFRYFYNFYKVTGCLYFLW